MRKSLLRTCFDESNIHCFPYVTKANHTIIERIFWFVCIVISIMFATYICLNQWTRFQEHPIVLSLESNYRDWILHMPAMTVCAPLVDDGIANEVVTRIFNVNINNTKYEYYKSFVVTVAQTNYLSLENYAMFWNDSELNSIVLLDIAVQMKGEHFLNYKPSDYNTTVVTELGICRSSSMLHDVQNPNKSRPFQRIPSEKCSASQSCKRDDLPHFSEAPPVTFYFHDEKDLMDPETSVQFVLPYMQSLATVQFSARWIVSGDDIKSMSPKRRQCLYYTEPMNRFYGVYTRNTCSKTCRIEAAIQFCNCIPFFYAVDSVEPTCNAAGMYCLSQHNWYNSRCVCMQECESLTYIVYQKTEFPYMEQFSREVSLSFEIPKTRIKRGVVFSMDGLIVSFGGAAALFLGCSFISVAEFVFFFLESLSENVFRIYRCHMRGRFC